MSALPSFDDAQSPTIIAGLAREWPASRWTFAALAERSGDVRVPVHTGRFRLRADGKGALRDGASTPMRVGEWVDALVAGRPAGYLAGLELLRAVKSLPGDLRFPRVSDSLTAVDVIWLGGAGTLTQLHFDRALNLNVQLSGRKRFTFFAPYREGLDPRRVTATHSMSALDLDPARPFDERGLVPDLELELQAGDGIFIPYGWWHRVRTLEPSIAVNRWWWSPRTVLGRAGDLVAALSRARRGPPPR